MSEVVSGLVVVVGKVVACVVAIDAAVATEIDKMVFFTPS